MPDPRTMPDPTRDQVYGALVCTMLHATEGDLTAGVNAVMALLAETPEPPSLDAVKERALRAAMEAVTVLFGRGPAVNLRDSLQLVLDEEGPEALVAEVVDAACVAMAETPPSPYATTERDEREALQQEVFQLRQQEQMRPWLADAQADLAAARAEAPQPKALSGLEEDIARSASIRITEDMDDRDMVLMTGLLMILDRVCHWPVIEDTETGRDG